MRQQKTEIGRLHHISKIQLYTQPTEFIIHVSLNMHKSLQYILSALLSITVMGITNAQYTEVINTNRPSQSMGAFSVGKNVYQWEQGISFRQGRFDAFNNSAFNGLGTQIQLRVGVFKEQMELIGTIDYQLDKLSFTNTSGDNTSKRNGIRDLAVGVKYLVFDPFRNTEKYKPNLYSYHANNKIRWRDLLPAVSLYVGAQFKTGDVYPYQENFYPLFDFNFRPIEEPIVSPSAILILQQHLKPGIVLVHNVGMRYITSAIQQLKWTGTLTYSTQNKWSFFGEYQIDDSTLHKDITLGTGVAYLFSKELQLDVAVQHSTKNTPKLLTAGIGVSYRLDKHNIWDGQPQDIKTLKEARKERKKVRKENKAGIKAERRTAKGLHKLDKKQKRIERKLKKNR